MKLNSTNYEDSVIIYARVSSKDQEVEGYSIPAQLKLLRDYATKNHYTVLSEFTDVETAKKAGRSQFNKMLTFLEANKHVKHILVEKTDRLLRNITDYALLDSLMERSNVKIHLVKENVMLSNDSRSNEKFIFGIKALMAKNYVDNLSEEVKKGMSEKASQGVYPSWAPYGYLNVRENGKSIISVDPATAPYIKKMFELYATGSYSLSTLRKKMLADGMVYRGGKNFYSSAVEHILKSEFYIGVFYWKGRRYENASHEPLVSKELFQTVQNILYKPTKNKSKKGLFPYCNLIRCGVCGCSLTAQIQKNKYIYYHCTGHKGNCKQIYLKQETIEKRFLDILTDIQVSEAMQSMIMEGVRGSLNDKIEYHNNLVSQLEQQIKTLQQRIDQAYLDKLDRKIAEDFWQKHTKTWMNEKEQLTVKLLAAQKADSHYLDNANLILELSKKAAQLYKIQNSEQKRRLIDLLVLNCSYKDEILDVELKPVFKEIMKIVKTGNWCARKESNPQPTDPKSGALSN